MLSASAVFFCETIGVSCTNDDCSHPPIPSFQSQPPLPGITLVQTRFYLSQGRRAPHNKREEECGSMIFHSSQAHLYFKIFLLLLSSVMLIT